MSDREDVMEKITTMERAGGTDMLLEGLVELSRGNDEGALELFTHLLAGKGESSLAAMCSAQLLLKKGDAAAAVALLEKARTEAPGSAALSFLLGTAYARTCRTFDAIACFRETLAIAPGDEQAREALEELLCVQEP
jgi:predicted Zn-dependent protease